MTFDSSKQKDWVTVAFPLRETESAEDFQKRLDAFKPITAEKFAEFNKKVNSLLVERMNEKKPLSFTSKFKKVLQSIKSNYFSRMAQYHTHFHFGNDEALEKKIIKKLNKIMASIQELQDQVTALDATVTTLQEKVDAEQAQIQALLDTNAAVVSDLNTQIATLTDALSTAPTPEQIQGVIDSVTATRDRVVAITQDVSDTIADAPETPTEDLPA